MMLGAAAPVSANEPTEARRTNAAVRVNGVRKPLRAYTIYGHNYFTMFEMAQALSATEKRFFVKWSGRNKELQMTSGRPFSAISFNLSGRAVDNEQATPEIIKVTLDGNEVDIAAYRIAGEHFFKLRDIAKVLNFSVEWNHIESSVDIDTGAEYVDLPAAEKIDPSKPMVALTFDDGPSGYTTLILNILEQYDVPATFFVIGSRIERNIDIVHRANDMGCEIASHTWSHRMLTRASDENIRSELLKAKSAIEAATGAPGLIMRPPFGSVNARVRSVAADLGIPVIYWSVDPQDWRTGNSVEIYDHIMTRVKDKDIILLHDTSGATVEAAKRVIPTLIDRGYQLVTVSELMHYSDVTLEPGVVYKSGRPR